MVNPAGPSAHLSWGELACHDAARTPYPLAWRATRAARLAVAFEAVRALLGVPLVVRSGYRTPAWNQQIGGALASQHVAGRAVDLAALGPVSVAELYAAALEVAQTVQIGGAWLIRGLGRYPSFVHVDVRPSVALVRWSGTGVE